MSVTSDTDETPERRYPRAEKARCLHLGSPVRQRRSLRAGEARFSYLAAGAGAPLVLLHGIGSNARSWHGQLAGLADIGLIVAWDAPGYGASAPLTPARPSAADYAGHLALFLDGLGFDRVDLLGHSLGALIAGAFAASRPHRVKRLILADVALGHGADPDGPLPARAQARLDDLAALGPAGLAAERAPQLLSAAATPAQIACVRETMADIDPAGYRQAVAMLVRGDLRADARTIDTPTLVLCGSDDGVTPPAGNRALAAVMANARYCEIGNAGHASYIEQPAAFNAAVREFLLGS